jgi:hypothetical protein
MYNDIRYFFGEKWLTFSMLAPLLDCMILGIQSFSFQICDVAKVMIIHKPI